MLFLSELLKLTTQFWHCVRKGGLSGNCCASRNFMRAWFPCSRCSVSPSICSTSIRTMKQLPDVHGHEGMPLKRAKSGRPLEKHRAEAFLEVARFLEENDDEQITIQVRFSIERNFCLILSIVHTVTHTCNKDLRSTLETRLPKPKSMASLMLSLLEARLVKCCTTFIVSAILILRKKSLG